MLQEFGIKSRSFESEKYKVNDATQRSTILFVPQVQVQYKSV